MSLAALAWCLLWRLPRGSVAVEDRQQPTQVLFTQERMAALLLSLMARPIGILHRNQAMTSSTTLL